MKVLSETYQTLLLSEPTPGVVVLALNRPARYNAMTNEMFDEL
ncbi:MAG: enoyl-CoA hydratase/isomerase, partial [Friedmanniella sp.]|nr:enoyl-CoA hydratase/isomerase [Friedmanniella sp.]